MDEKQFHSAITVIAAQPRWRVVNFKELWEYRELFWVLTQRDIKIRYKQTVLGVGWAIIQPVTMMILFSFFFGHLAKVPSGGLPYPLFVFCGLILWTFFSNAVAASSGSALGSANLISKVYFPRVIIPLSAVGSSIVDMLIGCGLLFLIKAYYGIGTTAEIFLAPVMVLGTAMFAIGVGAFLSALSVAYRDVKYVVPYFLQLGLFVSPVIYPPTFVPETHRWMLSLNPMTGLIDGFRAAFLGMPLDIGAIVTAMIISFLIFILGIAYFQRMQNRFADII